MQSSQTKGFASICLLRSAAVVKEKLHCVQLDNFSPEWDSMCTLRLSDLVQEYLHCLQTKGFSPVWIRMFKMITSYAGVVALFANNRSLHCEQDCVVSD